MTRLPAAHPRPALPGRPGVREGSSWRVPAALLALSSIPLVAGSLRLLEVAGGPQVLPTNPRIDASPTALVLHVVAAAVYVVVGAFQFPARLRRGHRDWHRRAGRVLVAAGLVVAGSGLWMTVSHPDAPGGHLLWTVRLVVGAATGTSIVLGLAAIRRRDVAAHRAWMIRAYALAVGAGTQVLTEGVGDAAFGTGDLSKALSMTSAWVVNAAVAEWVVRRPAHRRPDEVRTRAASVGPR